ncbi:hypothetical protein HNV28_08720 [Myxococcus xanthus]|uniref:Lipoprotein n=2 Tax=Myxococcus xanthus TaxID=34 RepID=A0A7Y4IFN8_MYXXA|nr:hypothetical protein [Myxococcus xanthus]NOJ88644.1 hypothetical protein [Myxococcus xanthus]
MERMRSNMSGRSVLAVSFVVLACAPAIAQTGQWSQPTKTEQWSQPPQQQPQAQTRPPAQSPAPTPPAPDKPAQSQPGLGSSPTAQQVDPRAMDNPEVVQPQGKVPAGMVGRWNLWVPGGIWYSTDGSRIYRNYTQGAAMNTLTIRANGTYSWGGTTGRLTEIRPWFAQPGERYFAVQLDADLKYMARHDAGKGKIDLFFWGVGGHAATGTR